MPNSDPTIKLRLATSEDVPALQSLIDQSVRALSVNYYTREQIESALANVFGVDTQLIADQTYFVAEVDGQIVGGGGWSKRQTLFGGDQAKSQDPDLCWSRVSNQRDSEPSTFILNGHAAESVD